jgi:hypothetical protein
MEYVDVSTRGRKPESLEITDMQLNSAGGYPLFAV